MHAEVDPRGSERARPAGRAASPGAPAAEKTRAAANEVVAWALGKLSCVGVAVSGGRSASCGRGRRTANFSAVLKT